MNSVDYENYYPNDGKLIHSYSNRKEVFSDLNRLEPVSGPNDFCIPMFSVPLCHIEIKNWEYKKKQLLNICKNVTSTNYNYKDAPAGDVFTDYHFNGRYGSSYSIDIHKILEDEIEFLEDMLINPNDFNDVEIPDPFNSPEDCRYSFRLENSWFETATKLSRHEAHTHGPVGYSCVVFVEYDPQVHTPTIFLNPFLSSFFGNPNDYQPSNLVKEGSLICFPSPIIHYTQPNLSDVDRLILSWNMSVVDQYNNRVLA